jgi:spore coat polysaccharide biosynthesis predicted glycosyltransferase SpsG
MAKPTIILATSNGVGMGHLARTTAIALALKEVANPIIVSMAGGIAEIPAFLDIRCEYIPGRDRLLMPRDKWDVYVRDRLLALIDETNANVLSFDGVVPYPGVFATKIKNKNLSLVWIRRGFWQRNLLRFVLPVYSKVMDIVIEPGDIAKAFDFGPTSKRKEAILTSPVSLFEKDSAKSRDDARRALGLNLDRPVALVQLGTGESDVNSKMTAALEGLVGWKDLQIVLTKEPMDKDGNSLAPEGLDLKVVRYFPLANVLAAFDASICATGYNGVHELLPARIPSVFVSNIRGTDDQEGRAKWCQEFGYALRADHSNLSDITATVKKLQNPEVRKQLSAKCSELPGTTGGAEIAKILFGLTMSEKSSKPAGISHIIRKIVYVSIRRLSLIYRYFRPHAVKQSIVEGLPVFADTTKPDEIREFIKSSVRFEHLIADASPQYRARRETIANVAYGDLKERRAKK